jgi:hypothetical protein
LNLWSSFTQPGWFIKLMLDTEFLFFAFFFMGLAGIARRRHTNQEYLVKVKI